MHFASLCAGAKLHLRGVLKVSQPVKNVIYLQSKYKSLLWDSLYIFVE